MKIQLREYQVEFNNQLNEAIPVHKNIVLALPPSFGKTEMVINLIQNNPNKRFLILTHGFNLLKEQWGLRLEKYGVPASTSSKDDVQVFYGLPHNKKEWQKLQNIDFVVIDEAHHFTNASMVKSIVQSLNPKNILYLTATPSVFVGKPEHHVILYPGIELIKQGYYPNLYVGIASTNAPSMRTPTMPPEI